MKWAEGTGMVHSNYRRQGVFRALVAAALEECQQNKTESLLLFEFNMLVRCAAPGNHVPDDGTGRYRRAGLEPT